MNAIGEISWRTRERPFLFERTPQAAEETRKRPPLSEQLYLVAFFKRFCVRPADIPLVVVL